MTDSRVVYRYQLQHGWKSLRLPKGHQVRHIAVRPGDGDMPSLWIEHPDPMDLEESECETVHFRFIGTGIRVPYDSLFVGSALSPDAALVWHVYRQMTDAEMEARIGAVARQDVLPAPGPAEPMGGIRV